MNRYNKKNSKMKIVNILMNVAIVIPCWIIGYDNYLSTDDFFFIVKIFPIYLIIIFFIFFVAYQCCSDDDMAKQKIMPYKFAVRYGCMLGILDVHGLPILNKLKEFFFSPEGNFSFFLSPGNELFFFPDMNHMLFQTYLINEQTGELFKVNALVIIIFQIIFYFIMLLVIYFLAFLCKKYILDILFRSIPEVFNDFTKNK